MADEQEIQDPPKDNPSETQDPPKEGDKSQAPNIENQEDLPEKFKGKSASEIAKSYIELEKKLGQTSVSQKRLAELEQLREFIASDPELVEVVKKKAGLQNQPSKQSNGDDTRDALSNQIVGDFEKDYGISNLDPEKRADMHRKIGEELRDMLDPNGEKSIADIVAGIKLPRLRHFLDKAYSLATKGDEAEQARVKGLIEARRNSEATFGSIPSTGAKSDSMTLSAAERSVAKKLGISEEKYLEQKKKLND